MLLFAHHFGFVDVYAMSAFSIIYALFQFAVAITFLVYGRRMLRKIHDLMARAAFTGVPIPSDGHSKLRAMATNIIMSSSAMLVFVCSVPFAFLSEYAYYPLGRLFSAGAIFFTANTISFFQVRCAAFPLKELRATCIFAS